MSTYLLEELEVPRPPYRMSRPAVRLVSESNPKGDKLPDYIDPLYENMSSLPEGSPERKAAQDEIDRKLKVKLKGLDETIGAIHEDTHRNAAFSSGYTPDIREEHEPVPPQIIIGAPPVPDVAAPTVVAPDTGTRDADAEALDRAKIRGEFERLRLKTAQDDAEAAAAAQVESTILPAAPDVTPTPTPAPQLSESEPAPEPAVPDVAVSEGDAEAKEAAEVKEEFFARRWKAAEAAAQSTVIPAAPDVTPTTTPASQLSESEPTGAAAGKSNIRSSSDITPEEYAIADKKFKDDLAKDRKDRESVFNANTAEEVQEYILHLSQRAEDDIRSKGAETTVKEAAIHAVQEEEKKFRNASEPTSSAPATSGDIGSQRVSMPATPEIQAARARAAAVPAAAAERAPNAQEQHIAQLQQSNAELQQRVAQLEAQNRPAGGAGGGVPPGGEGTPNAAEAQPTGPGEGERQLDELLNAESGDTEVPGWWERRGVYKEVTAQDWASWWSSIWAKMAKDSLAKRVLKVKDLEKKAKAMHDRSWVGTALIPFTYGPRIVWHKRRQGILEAAQAEHDAIRVQHENYRNELLNNLSNRYETAKRSFMDRANIYARQSGIINEALDEGRELLRAKVQEIIREPDRQRKAELIEDRDAILQLNEANAVRRLAVDGKWQVNYTEFERIQSVQNQILKYAKLPSPRTEPAGRERTETRVKREPEQPKSIAA